MGIAEKFADLYISPLIKKEKKFNNVLAGSSTANNGCITVQGVVNSEADLKELKTLVKSTNPPLTVDWSKLYVIEGSSELQKISEKEKKESEQTEPR